MFKRLKNRWTYMVCLFIFLITTKSSLFAQQQIQLEVTSFDLNDKFEEKIYLLKFDKDRYYHVDSNTFSPRGKVNFMVDEGNVRMYSIRHGDYPNIEFIVSNSDKDILISTTPDTWKNNDYKLSGSNENYCWGAIQKAQKQFQIQSSEWLTKKYELDKFDPQLIHKYDRYDSLFNEAILGFNEKMDEIEKWYPATVCGSFVAKNSKLPSRFMTEEWKKKFDNDFAFWHQHYFDFLSFDDPRQLNFPHFRVSFDTYVKNYTQKSNQGLKHFINLLFSREMAPEIQTFLTELYLQYFMSLNNEEMVLYLLQKDEDNCETEVETSNLVETLKKLKQGESAPDIGLIDLRGKTQRLSQVSKQKNITALVFFSPTCHHCHELLKELKALRKTYEFNVFTISSGESKVTEQFINDNEFDWITCIYSKDSQSDTNPYNNYAVLRVPTLVLIDKNQRLITRFGNLHDLRLKLQK